jgi:uncharacterized protein (DUF736 family)
MLKLALFRTKQKTSDKSPDFSSKFTLSESVSLEAGEEYELAGWNTTSKNGLEYISVLIKKIESNATEGEEDY